MLFRTILLTCVVLLVGCATQTKPQLTEQGYVSFARVVVATDRCGRAGYMPPETASFGLSVLQSRINQYEADEARMQQAVNASPTQVTPELCNKLSMDIAAAKRNIDSSNAAAQSNSKAWQDYTNSQRNRNATCYTIGGQTLCNSF